MANTKKIGFIGLGNMGMPMAEKLLNAGFPLTVWNRTIAKAEPLRRLGARVEKNASEVAKRVDVVITMLSNDDAVSDVALGGEGIITGIRPNKVYMDMSTITPELTKKLGDDFAAKDAKFLDVKVSGTVPSARTGNLVLMIGGDRGTFDENIDIFNALAKGINYMGEVGKAAYMKIALNALMAQEMQGLAEAIALAESAEIEKHLALSVINETGVSSEFIKGRTPKIEGDDYVPLFKIGYMVKDLTIALEIARKEGIIAPGINASYEAFKSASDRMGDVDMSALVKFYEIHGV